MEEKVRRLLSRFWLLLAAVLPLLGYIPRLSGIECFCYNEPYVVFPICHWEGDRCTGDICYAHKVLQDGVFYSTWNCLQESLNEHTDLVCVNGSFNTATEQYICCSGKDNCNENIRIELPIERRTQPEITDPVTSVATTMAESTESGSGSGSSPLGPSPITTTEHPDVIPESTSRSTTPVTSRPASRPPSTPSVTTQGTPLQCFCSACSTKRNSCGLDGRCYVGKDFQPGQDVDYNSATVTTRPGSYSWGCFSEAEAVTKCRETDKYRCCSDEDLCNEHLQPPPLKCFCPSGTCPDGQDYVSCGADAVCYVSLPSDSSSTDASPDSLVWGCFDQSEARVKCNNTHRYNCCLNSDYCNQDLEPPMQRNEECTSTSGDCETKQHQNFISIPMVASVTVVVALVMLVALSFLFVVLLVQIRRLERGGGGGGPVASNSTTSESSENSVTTESESLPSPTSATSPHHHYLHITADYPAFGDSLKCNDSKA